MTRNRNLTIVAVKSLCFPCPSMLLSMHVPMSAVLEGSSVWCIRPVDIASQFDDTGQ